MSRARHQLWRSEVLEGTELQIGVGVKDHNVDAHFHEQYQFVLVEEGRRHFRRGRCSRPLDAGGISIVNPGELHAGWCHPSGSTFRTLHLPVEALLSAVIETRNSRGTAMIAFPDEIRDPDVVRAYQYAHAALAGGSSDPGVALLAVQRFAIAAWRAVSDEPCLSLARPCTRRVAVAREHVHAHAERAISLDELSDVCQCDKYHLVRSFRDVMGTTPHRYQLAVRIDRAKTMLRSDKPLSGIASDLGFSDQSHFGGAFKRMTGFTPRSYRSQMRSGVIKIAARRTIVP